MGKKENNTLTKKDLYDALEDQAQTIIEAVNFGFEKAKEDRKEIKDKLSSLERRVIALEDITTEHGKELKKIRKILSQLQKQRNVGMEKADLLEKKIIQLEAKVA